MNLRRFDSLLSQCCFKKRRVMQASRYADVALCRCRVMQTSRYADVALCRRRFLQTSRYADVALWRRHVMQTSRYADVVTVGKMSGDELSQSLLHIFALNFFKVIQQTSKTFYFTSPKMSEDGFLPKRPKNEKCNCGWQRFWTVRPDWSINESWRQHFFLQKLPKYFRLLGYFWKESVLTWRYWCCYF